jgi:hypothetical protein
MVGAIRSSEMSVLTIGTRRHILEDGILHSHSRKNIEFYKTILVTERGGLWVSKMSKIPHCINNWIKDGDKDVRLTHRPRSTPHKEHFSASATNFSSKLSEPLGPSGGATIMYPLSSYMET